MAYNFKRLAEVDSAADIQASDSFFIEQNGQVKKANLTNVSSASDIQASDLFLIEQNGQIGRAHV